MWAADHGRWFNPSVRPELPDFERAVSIADELGRGRRLLPELSGDFSFGAAHVAGTHLAIREQGRRSEHQLDVQVVYPVQVAGLPVVGGGGDFTFALGDGGDLIGFSGVWREAEGAFDAAMLPRDQSDEAHKALFASAKGLELESVESYLAYYAAPTFTVQEFLYPVYVYLATARIGERSVPLRAVMLPATDFGPRVVLPPLAPARPKRSRPAALPSAEERPRRSYEYGKPRPRALFAATKPWEAGTSWIGTSGG